MAYMVTILDHLRSQVITVFRIKYTNLIGIFYETYKT